MKVWSEAIFWLLCFTLTGINLVLGGSDEPCDIEATFSGLNVARLINDTVHTNNGSKLICQCTAGQKELQETLWRGPDRRQISRKKNSNSPVTYRRQRKDNGNVRAILTITTRFSCTNTGLYTCQIGMGNIREFFLTPSGETCIPQNLTINAIVLRSSENGTTLNITCTADNPLSQIYNLSYSWRINNVTDPSEKGKDIVVTVKSNPIVICSVSNLVGTSHLTATLIIQPTQSTSVLPTTLPTSVLPTALTTTTPMPTPEATPPLLTISAESTPLLLTTSAESTPLLLATPAESTLLLSSILSTDAPYNLTETPTTFLSAAPPTTFLSAAPPTTFLSAAPPTTFLSAAPPTTFLPIAPPTPFPIIPSLTSSDIETITPPFTEVTTSTAIKLSTSSIIEMSITIITKATSSPIIEPSLSIAKSAPSTSMQPTPTAQPEPITIEPLSIIKSAPSTTMQPTPTAQPEPITIESLSITKSAPSTTMQPTPTAQPDPITIEPLQQSATNKSVNITLLWSRSETPIGNQTVAYSWTSLWANRVAKRDSSNRESVTVSKDATSHTVVDADGFSTYCFTISAEFSNYNYTTSTKCDETLPTQPSEPINVQVLSHYGDSAWVSWDIPQRPNGNITLFQVYVNNNPVDQLEYGQYVVRKGVRVFQLQQGVTYTFKVSATNQAGEGVTSQPVSYTHRELQRSQGLPPLSSGVVAALVIVIITAFLLWLIIFGCIIFIYLKKQSESSSQDGKGIQIVSEEKGGEGSYVKTTTSKGDYVDSEDVDTQEAADEKKSQGDEEAKKKNTPSASEEGPESQRKDPLDVGVETEMVTVKFDDDSSDDPATSQRRFYSDTAV